MVADGICTSAMLSKLALLVSSGSHESAEMVSPSTSWMLRSYSARLRRWNVRRPGLGARNAFASIRRSRVVISTSSVSPPGRDRPGGGIIPVRNLPIIFSATSGDVEPTVSRSKPASDRLPSLRVSL